MFGQIDERPAALEAAGLDAHREYNLAPQGGTVGTISDPTQRVVALQLEAAASRHQRDGRNMAEMVRSEDVVVSPLKAEALAVVAAIWARYARNREKRPAF